MTDQLPGMTDQATFHSLMTMLKDYFDGLYFADIQKLRKIFHPDAALKAPGQRRSRDEWLQQVANRPIPAELQSPYRFRVLSLEVIKDQAMAKVECPLFDYFYVDYLGFLYENDHWQIVNKMYTDISDT
ncbi:nuclear transport factor 2 family protein [Hahella ganghwensis]|uniref:nuclear transport factor 2 family protein n=1 Tax=Hahella ganghwensis TaxID=286420 RepID=UPI00036E8B70|nr:nuclear transport factor 2 family protein [Hahella ganghwensis]